MHFYQIKTLPFLYGSTYKKWRYLKSHHIANTRHALNRYLKRPPFPRKIDIISNPEFAGNGKYPEMETDDLRTLYNNIYMDQSTLSCLANRVQMNIKLYGCPRTNENMESMTKDTLVIRTYADTGRRYVMEKVDE